MYADTLSPVKAWASNFKVADGNYWSSSVVKYNIQDVMLASGYGMMASLTTIKKNGISGGFSYSLAWSIQVNFRTALIPGNILQQWISPMWVASDAT